MAILIDNPVQISRDHYMLRFDSSSLKPSVPGQFVGLRVSPGTDPLIRRPFSIFDRTDATLDIVIKKIGRGTAAIAEFTAKEDIDMLGPLGRGFTMTEGRNVLLIGGGVGNAPLYYLAGELLKRNNSVTYLYCSRSREYIYLLESFIDRVTELLIATDDGTAGKKGFAPGIAREIMSHSAWDMVYTCGPTIMMRAIAGLAETHGIPLEVSMENYFGCGIGLCSGCTVETFHGNRRACIDGPVMDGRSILWDTIPI